MGSWLFHYYTKTVIERPVIALACLALIVVFFGFQAPNFKLDASADSLVLENDEALRYYRSIREIYGSDDFLVVTYSPFDDLLSPDSLAVLESLRDELSQLDRVASVTTILDVPLLNSPKVELSELSTGVKTLQTPGVDLELARKEFVESPIYRNNLVSPDGRTAALQVIFKHDKKYFSLLKLRNDLREKRLTSGLTSEESRQLRKASRAFSEHLAIVVDADRERVKKVRMIMDTYRDKAKMYLGGVSMVTSDMISFIEHDLVVFGLGVVGFLVLALSFFFRKVRWVVLPMSCCVLSVIVMVGYLGFLDWRVTVISSNFISLLLIITMSLTIHLIVRYRILARENPTADQRTLVQDTVRIMAEPCFYTAITTIVAFGSLVVSDIRPVIDFGWMMTIGIAVAFVLNFIFFPSLLTLLPREYGNSEEDSTTSFTLAVASFTQNNTGKIVIFCSAVAVLSLIGISKLEVENRFIDHFKSSTEIYQGMELIDTELGGTVPLDVIIDADEEFYAYLEELEESQDPFEDPFETEVETSGVSYWFNADMLGKAEEIHDYLDKLPEVGKVLSIATAMKVFRQLNDGRMPDDYDLAVIRRVMPEDVKKALIDPYLSQDANQTRITMRLVESSPTLRRQALINKIHTFLVEEMGFAQENVHLSGMAVLYNNMLQSLYRSQILTLGVVFVSILAMFIVLFRSLYLAILAIIPNLLAAGLILGLMGWVGKPLDVMTITIAAIVVGIAVDHAIHYIHRFRVEFERYRDYAATVRVCHGSIGRAIYYTALTITVGFSILALSNFIPTIYFGLLIGLAMLVALLSNLTLLPALLLIFKPLGRGMSEE
ncbi:MAG: RND family transporter [Nitrospirae bacterium]|nr:RND family transporter [Nitrospirota bacterium]